MTGCIDLSVREASRGVNDDYSNASSHLFLANSYNALRDPTRINLRYETPWFNELLLANLLAPVGGGPLSQFVSEQEYSKIFEANRFGISSTSTYLSTANCARPLRNRGIYREFSYSFDTEFQYNNGHRPNNEITRSESYGQVKMQLTPQGQRLFPNKVSGHAAGRPAPALRSDSGRARAFTSASCNSRPSSASVTITNGRRECTPFLLAGRLADEISFSDLNSSRRS